MKPSHDVRNAMANLLTFYAHQLFQNNAVTMNIQKTPEITVDGSRPERARRDRSSSPSAVMSRKRRAEVEPQPGAPERETKRRTSARLRKSRDSGVDNIKEEGAAELFSCFF